MRIGHLLKLWRRQNRLTLRVAAGRIGLTAGTLGRLEKGEAMHGVTLATVLVWLMGREEPSGNEAFTFETEEAVALKESGETGDIHKNSGENDVILKSFHDVAECNTSLSREEAGQVHTREPSGNSGEFDEGTAVKAYPTMEEAEREKRRLIPAEWSDTITSIDDWNKETKALAAAFEDKPEAVAEFAVHAMDQDAALCGLREERGGGGAHGASGVGAEGS